MIFPSTLTTPHCRFQHSCTVGKQIRSLGTSSKPALTPAHTDTSGVPPLRPGRAQPGRSPWRSLLCRSADGGDRADTGQGPAAPAGTPGSSRAVLKRARTGLGGSGTTAGAGSAPLTPAQCRWADPWSDGTRPWREEKGTSVTARQGEGQRHQSWLCAGSHKAPLWQQRLSTESRAFRLERAGGGSYG